MNEYTLSNGVKIPVVGFGTWQTPSGAIAVQSVLTALEYGYRHIDCAAIYRNEKSIGEALKETSIPRDEIFITSKVWNTNRGYEKTILAFEKTLADLQLDYLDLYLVHWPANAKQYKDSWQQLNAETWRALENLYKSGRIKAIGVSNFLPHHLEPLLGDCQIMPMVDQIEFHPGYMQQETVDYCKQKNIIVEAWAPLGRGRLLENETLKSIATKYNKSAAQVCIKWCLQHGTLPLPKSVTPQRIKENLDIFDFKIEEQDMQEINDLPYLGGSGEHPDKIDF
jgi:diketogulonate reductase-like aldo/keto reductase